jgi:hypothetical protein
MHSATYASIVALRPRSSADVPPPAEYVCKQLCELGLWVPCRSLCSRRAGLRFVRRRDQRAGRHVQEERVCYFSLTTECLHSSLPSVAPFGVRAAQSTTVLGCLNIRSLLCKFDDIFELCRDRCIDLLCLTESWHDS